MKLVKDSADKKERFAVVWRLRHSSNKKRSVFRRHQASRAQTLLFKIRKVSLLKASWSNRAREALTFSKDLFNNLSPSLKGAASFQIETVASPRSIPFRCLQFRSLQLSDLRQIVISEVWWALHIYLRHKEEQEVSFQALMQISQVIVSPYTRNTKHSKDQPKPRTR